MNLNHLNYFRVLARVEHYTKAASMLGITQPTLSHAISTLEKDLGTYLFEKQGRNVQLTKYGHFYLNYVDNALDELEIGEKKLRELTSSSKGIIDLAFVYSLGSHFIPSLLKEFICHKQYMGISFNFNQGNTRDILNSIKNDEYDLGFCSFVEGEPDIEFLPIVKQELVLVVPIDHHLAVNNSIDLKDIEKYPLIFYTKKSGMRSIIDTILKDANINPNVKCEIEEDSALAGLISIGYGIGIMPNISALKNFNVKVIQIKNLTQERFIYLAYMKNKYYTPAVTLFRNFTLDYCNKNTF